MSSRAKLLLVLMLTVCGASAAVGWGAIHYTRQQFDEFQQRRSEAVAAQFKRELVQRGDELVFAVQGLADAESTLRMALDLNRPQADPSIYVNDAHGLAESRQLDFLELVGEGGVVISSAQWPERVGSKNEWVVAESNWNQVGAFLSRVEEPDTVELGLLAVRMMNVGGKRLYLIGGRRLDAQFLRAVSMPEGMTSLLYRNLEAGFVPSALTSTEGVEARPERFSSLIEQMQRQSAGKQASIQWTEAEGGTESFSALPLAGRNGALMGVLLLGSDQHDEAVLIRRIEIFTLAVGAGAMLLGAFLVAWLADRITRPMARMTAVAREVGAGNWSAQVGLRSKDEAGKLARAFDDMIRQLREKHERVLQTERVAAWREMALRITNELTPALMLQESTLKELNSALPDDPVQADSPPSELLKKLRAEGMQLQETAARFRDFAKMPAPRLQMVSVNDAVRQAIKEFEPQFNAVGRPPVTPELYLDENVAPVQADEGQLAYAVKSLVARSLDSMPAGGALTIRTTGSNATVKIEVSDTGAEGLETEDVQSGLSPQYAAKLHGTGLGLATVQSVICEHGGRISVQWVPGAGTTFLIELPAAAGVLATSGNAVKADAKMQAQTDRRTSLSREPDALPAAGFSAAIDSSSANASHSPTPSAYKRESSVEGSAGSVDESAAALSPEAARAFDEITLIVADAVDHIPHPTLDSLMDSATYSVPAELPETAIPHETSVDAAMAAVGNAADCAPGSPDDAREFMRSISQSSTEPDSPNQAAPQDSVPNQAQELQIVYELFASGTFSDNADGMSADTPSAVASKQPELEIARAGEAAEPGKTHTVTEVPDTVSTETTSEIATEEMANTAVETAFFEITSDPNDTRRTKATDAQEQAPAEPAQPKIAEVTPDQPEPQVASLEPALIEEPLPVARKRYSVVVKTLFS